MKTRFDELAIFGGQPLSANGLHVGAPNLPDRADFHQRVDAMLDRRWLTNHGPSVRELEGRLAELLGVKQVVTMCNGTLALQLTLRALDLTGEIIMPSMTFVATAHAAQWLGLHPVFCDVDPHTHNLDPRRVEALITPFTSAILGVHLWGRACAVEALEGIARRYHLRLIFDAAHAFGCTHAGRPMGGFGDAEVFSFHATKFFHTLEGGAVSTDSEQLAEKLRLMQNFGFDDYDSVVSLGVNAKLNELCATMGLSLLDHLPELVACNRLNYLTYQANIAGLRGIEMVIYPDSQQQNYQYVVLEVDPACGLSRDQLVRVLWAENVLARRYFTPGVHRMEPYHTLNPQAGAALPETERLVQRTLCLPTGTAVSTEVVEEVCAVIRLAVENAAEVRSKLDGGK
jgi:dTDP-4-amino-4,6-dideoxygalactose transaminase